MENKREIELSNKILNKIYNQSRVDPDFKKKVILEPNKVIDDLFGGNYTISEDLKIVVEDQSDSSYIYLNIPTKNYDWSDFELTEEQLEVVSGGNWKIDVLTALCPPLGLGYRLAEWIHEC